MLLSVVLPVYNEATTVAQVIDEVLGLDLPGVDLELVIVESNSTDGSRDIVLAHGEDSRVRLVLEEHPSGKGHAVREGFRQARGEIILIQDADLEYRIDDTR